MRDGEGNKLSDAEVEKVKSAEVKPADGSLNKVSVDLQVGEKAATNTDAEPMPPTPPGIPTF
ncbi:hypothetical protein [Bosea sp. PAMC 26642]|uniref:hypothetical protein n=1 Tax=Bosea sp. (strain PAMC 26642) TaxID=1792307 RepID=UPI0007703051|nr:hypothetical protein [Bosea sp. PAMC 26642]AMJ61059.1 hypothetical protein AXW83_12850 [Bosea sp. PAMC 26642]